MRVPKVPSKKLAPILVALDAAMVMREHWGRLEARDRRELLRILKKSQGRPSNLTSRDRSELIRIVRALDPVTAGRKLMPFKGGVPKSKL
jgi:hypothetical protein